MANEKRLIDANALMASLRESLDELREISDGLVYDEEKKICNGQICTFLESIMRVREQSTVDAVEVVHGRWHKPTPCSQEFCTNCGLTPKTNFGWLPPYCPNCGAKMRGDSE